MNSIILNNKPLIEAIFEMRWKLINMIAGREDLKTDPNYKLLVGAYYNKIREKFPYYEQLQSSNIPDEIAAYILQHRFRKVKDGWPLTQIGPGVLTLNDTNEYCWAIFQENINNVLNSFFEVYQEPENLKLESLTLRYINDIECFSDDKNILGFIKENLHTEINVYDRLFENTDISKNLLNMNLSLAYQCFEPKGIVSFKLYRAAIKNKKPDSLMLDIVFQSNEDDLPIGKEEIFKWAEIAHKIAEDWFLKIIEGNLLERFK